jgi:hypothetical protein
MTSVGSNGSSGAAVILPIDLLFFDGELNGKQVDLNWQTTLEVNTDYFVIERSLDGVTFQAIGQVGAQGPYVDYRFTDYDPKVGFNYYRLKIVEHDGRIGYSHSIAIKLGQVDFAITKVFPIPTLDLIQIDFTIAEAIDLEIEIQNVLGGVEFRTPYASRTGANQTTVDLSALKPGIYLLYLKSPTGEQQIRRVVKQ